MTPKPPVKPHGLHGLLGNKRVMYGALALAVIGFIYLRRSSSSSTVNTTPDPNAVDPATGLTYAAEQQAGLAASSPGTTLGDSGGGGTTPSADNVLTDQGTSVAAALEGLTAGLTGLQTQQANDEALQQSVGEAVSQLSEAYTTLTSLGAAGPAGVGVGASTPAISSGGGTVTQTTNNISGGTVYQAPVYEAPIYEAPVTVAPAPSTPAPASAPPAATPPPPAPVVSTVPFSAQGAKKIGTDPKKTGTVH